MCPQHPCHGPRLLLLIAFNKPYGVLSQFTDGAGRATLAGYLTYPGVYPAGRLDRDSEGLLLLTDDGRVQHTISAPSGQQRKCYLVQVEGIVTQPAVHALRAGVMLRGRRTRRARVRPVPEPAWLWPRHPPIRERRHIPTTWLEIRMGEGRNRQIRHMTAAVGHPTLRLIRTALDPFALDGLLPGQWRELDPTPLLRPDRPLRTRQRPR